MKKKLSILFILSLTFSIIGYNFRFNIELEETPVAKKDWTTFQKKGRKIASVPTIDKDLKTIKQFQERKVINTIKKDITKVDIPKWKEILGVGLSKFQKEETKVLVKEIDHVIDKNGEEFKRVLITFLFKNKKYNSYNALVNPINGNILKTWNRTIHENFNKKKRIRILPSNL